MKVNVPSTPRDPQSQVLDIRIQIPGFLALECYRAHLSRFTLKVRRKRAQIVVSGYRGTGQRGEVGLGRGLTKTFFCSTTLCTLHASLSAYACPYVGPPATLASSYSIICRVQVKLPCYTRDGNDLRMQQNPNKNKTSPLRYFFGLVRWQIVLWFHAYARLTSVSLSNGQRNHLTCPSIIIRQSWHCYKCTMPLRSNGRRPEEPWCEVFWDCEAAKKQGNHSLGQGCGADGGRQPYVCANSCVARCR